MLNSRIVSKAARGIGLRAWSTALLCACGFVAGTGPAQAEPQQVVFVTAPGSAGGNQIERGPGHLTVQAEYGRTPSGEDPGSAVRNLATARPGSIGVLSESGGNVASGGATASTTGTYMIVGPGGEVPVSLNVSLEGGLGVEGGQRSPSAGASVEFHYTFGGLGQGTFTATLSKGANLSPAVLRLGGSSFSDNPFENATATATGFGWDKIYTTQTVMLPVGTWLSMQLLTAVRSSLGSGVNDAAAFGRAGASFEDTVSLPYGIDVFNLPEGYTVQSADFGIVNNRYGIAAAVPEPASYALLGIGLVALGWARRRQPSKPARFSA